MSTVEYADMAELADAHGSGPCEGYFMEVRVLLSAPDRSKASFAPTYFFDKNKSSARSAPLLLIFRKKARYGFLILSFTFHYFYDNLLQPAPIRKQGYMLRTEFSALSFMSFSPLVSKYDLTFPYSLIKNETIKINSLIFDFFILEIIILNIL